MKNDKRHRILIDCDGVLSDFTSAALNLIEERTGDVHTPDEIKHWDIFKALDKADLEHILEDEIERGGFCLNLKPLPGARTLMRLLKETYDVFVVTSPFLAREWAYERTRWLECHFGIPADRVIHAKSKYVVYGDALIDDSAKNLRAWQEAWPDKLAIIYDAPYNQDDTEFKRANDWCDVIRLLKEGMPE